MQNNLEWGLQLTMSQFKGTYVFKQNGEEIGRSSNLITSNGRTMLMQYLAGSRTNWASDIAIGAMDTTPTSSDTQLNFEAGRYPVILKSYIAKNSTTGDPDLIVIRGTVPENTTFNIYEIGTYATSSSNSPSSSKNNLILSDMSDLTNWTATAGSVVSNQFTPQGTGSPRIGQYSISIPQSTTYVNNNVTVPFTNYNSFDSLQILVYNTTAGNLSVKLTDIMGYTQTINFTLTNNTGYSVLSTLFDKSVGSGTDRLISSFTYIKSISISTDSSAGLTIDAIKTSSSSEISIEESLVSKSVLSTPIAKLYNIPLDIEYYVELL